MSDQPPWKRPREPEESSPPPAEPTPPPEPTPALPTPPDQPTPEAEAPRPADPVAPAFQLPPPGTPGGAPAPSGGGRNRLPLLLGGAAALAVAVAVVLALVLGGNDSGERPTPPDPTQVAEETPEPEPTATAPQPTAAESPGVPAGATLADLIQEQVGPFRQIEMEKGEVLLEEENASEAYLVEYQGPGGRLSHQVGALESAERAQMLLAERIAERREQGDRIPPPQPYVKDGAEVGLIAFSVSKQLTVAFFTDSNLYATVLAGEPAQVEAFVEELPY